MNQNKKPEIPSQGAFPLHRYTRRVVASWNESLTRQASIWNNAWEAMKRGDYGVEDWFKAMAESTDLTLEAMEAAWPSPLRDEVAENPVWVFFDIVNGPYRRLVKLPITTGLPDDPPATKLSLLGGKEDALPEIAVNVTAPDQLRVQLRAPEERKGRGGKKSLVRKGEYIGFIYTPGYDRPLVVVSTVARQDITSEDLRKRIDENYNG